MSQPRAARQEFIADPIRPPIDGADGQSPGLIGGTILAVLVGLIFVVINLPMQYVETNAEWFGVMEFPTLSPATIDPLPSMAGWPLRYYVGIDHRMASGARHWSWLSLCANVAIGLVCVAAMVSLAWFRSKAIGRATDHRQMRFRFDAAMALGMFLLPVVVIVPIVAESQRHDRIATRIARQGNFLRSCWIPAPLAGQMPSGLLRWMSRIRRIQAVHVDDSVVDAMFDVQDLVQFDSLSGTFDGRSLKRLAGHHHFRKLTLGRQQIGKVEVDAIEELPWLLDLSVAQSTIDPLVIKRLMAIEGLETVDLSLTNIESAQLGTPAWSRSVKHLVLSRPKDGFGGALTIEGWPELSTLAIHQSDRGPNPSEFRLKLKDLPNLERCRLDRMQKHSLHLANVPKLIRIDDTNSPINFFSSEDIWLPALGWYSELILEDMPGLLRMSCFARDLTIFRLHNVPNLQEFQLGAFLMSSFGGSFSQPVDADQCQKWISEIAKVSGPRRLVLSALPLRGLDLSPIARNEGIRQLHLEGSGVTFEDVQGLANMRFLTTLELGTCEIKDDQMAWFTARFPNLEVLKINGNKLRIIDMQGDPNVPSRLRQIEVSRLSEIERLCIKDQPQLVANFRVEHPIKELVLENARGLCGFAMTEPWPASASVSGLRDVKWFAAGGPNVNNDLIDVLLKCPDMDQLTLAFTAISTERLERIGDFRQLTVLIIPGSDIDDRVTSHWSKLGSLWEVNLDDSRVGVQTIAWLSGIESLRSLSLSNVPLDAAARASLAELRQVTAIRLRNCPITTKDALRLLESESLEILDLSGCDIDAKAVIEKASRLGVMKGLILQGADVDEAVIEAAFQQSDKLAIDLSLPIKSATKAATVDTDAESGVNDPDNSLLNLPENLDDDVSDSVVDVLRRAAPISYPESLKVEMARRMSRFRIAVRRTQATTMRNQSEDPAWSAIFSHETITLEEIRDQRERMASMEAKTLYLFATTMDSGRIDLDHLRRIVKPTVTVPNVAAQPVAAQPVAGRSSQARP